MILGRLASVPTEDTCHFNPTVMVQDSKVLVLTDRNGIFPMGSIRDLAAEWFAELDSVVLLYSAAQMN